jgi:hypothetical protein
MNLKLPAILNWGTSTVQFYIKFSSFYNVLIYSYKLQEIS